MTAQTTPGTMPHATRRPNAPAPDDSHGDSSVLRLGVVTGAIGATVVACWFLAIDVLAGHPLFTPAFLGGVLAGNVDPQIGEGPNRVGWAALYTPVHYLVFAIAGVAAAALLRLSARMPGISALLVMLLMAFAVAFTGIIALLERTALGTLAWYQLAAGGLVGGLAMGAYLYRHRPSRAAA